MTALIFVPSGVSLAVFGAIAKLPDVVHNIRDLRAYRKARRSKRSRAGVLQDLTAQAETSINRLKEERRDGRRLVPRPLSDLDRRLIKFCRSQAQRAVEFDKKIKEDTSYNWKHCLFVLFGVSHKKQELDVVLADCEIWLAVAFHTTNL